jgi:hypothetical protein
MLMTTPPPDKINNDVTGRTNATPEMVKAGVAEFYSYDERFEDPEDVIRRIWRAMLAAAKS